MRLRFALPVLASLLAASTASAQAPADPEPPPPNALSPRASGHRVWLSTDVWPARDFLVATMGIGAQIAVYKTIAIDVDVPWAFGGTRRFVTQFSANTDMRAVFGNITLGVHDVVKPIPALALSYGASVSIPTHLRYEVTNNLDFATAAATSRGYYDAQRLAPEIVFVRIPLGLEWRFADVFHYRAELTPQIWAPVGEDVNSKRTQLLIEHADELEVRAHVGFGGGVRVQAAFAATKDIAFLGGDRAQAALEPFLGFEPAGRGLFGRFGLLFGLDSPLGFGFKLDRLAALRMQIGGKF